MIEAFAPAKLNLTLHVTGQKADGYHTLSSLVVFVDVGDRLRLTRSDVGRFHVTGPFSSQIPLGPDNLVRRAAALVGAAPVDISLEKNLPPASGIGGGSSDAAATLRALHALGVADAPSAEALLSLGADLPVCFSPQPTHMAGIGEVLTPVAQRAPLSLILVNPGLSVATPAVFSHLAVKTNSEMPLPIPEIAPTDAFAAWLERCRNDLEAPACAIAPEIARVLNVLRTLPGARLARMSGSGATCFALMESASAAEIGAEDLRSAHPDWWISACKTLDPAVPLLTE